MMSCRIATTFQASGVTPLWCTMVHHRQIKLAQMLL